MRKHRDARAVKRRRQPLITADGRYLVVRGRLWRASNPELSESERSLLVLRLMTVRRAVRDARAISDHPAEATARREVNAAKHGLGKRGAVWWDDGTPDYNRHMAHNTPYA